MGLEALIPPPFGVAFLQPTPASFREYHSEGNPVDCPFKPETAGGRQRWTLHWSLALMPAPPATCMHGSIPAHNHDGSPCSSNRLRSLDMSCELPGHYPDRKRTCFWRRCSKANMWPPLNTIAGFPATATDSTSGLKDMVTSTWTPSFKVVLPPNTAVFCSPHGISCCCSPG